MTSHLEEGPLQELLDGEIPSSELPPIQAHLANCAECRARLAEAREFAGEADRMIQTIELTDQDPPRPAAFPPRARATRWGRDLAWAATVVVALGAGYLARGSAPRSLARQENAAVAPEPVAAPMALPGEPAEMLQKSATDAVAERRADRQQAANLPAPKASRQPASPAMAEQAAAAEDKLGAAAVERSKDLIDSIRGKHTIREMPLKLEEVVVTSAAESPRRALGFSLGKVAAPAPPATQPLAARANEIQLDQVGTLSAGSRRDADPVAITFLGAVERLGGAMRLIEGMVPLRLEVLEPDVRVVYPITGGELILAQRLENGNLTYRLVAPAGFPADSLDRLRARVRD